jgi:hypothetical protein
VDVTVVWGGKAQVVGLNIRPAMVVTEYTPPAYVTYANFKESAVTVDALLAGRCRAHSPCRWATGPSPP